MLICDFCHEELSDDGNNCEIRCVGCGCSCCEKCTSPDDYCEDCGQED